MEEVVEVGVRDGVARLGPGELLLPALVEDDIDAATEDVRRIVHVENTSRRRAGLRGPGARADRQQRAVDEVDEVLLRDGAATLLPRAVADDVGVHLRERVQVSMRKRRRCAARGLTL